MNVLRQTEKEIKDKEVMVEEINRAIEQTEEEELYQQAEKSRLNSELDKMRYNSASLHKEVHLLRMENLSFRETMDRAIETEKLIQNLAQVDKLRMEMKESTVNLLQDLIVTLDFNYELQAPSQKLSTFSQLTKGF